MDIYCTRPRCEQPLNSFPDLDGRWQLKTFLQRHCAHCETPLVLNGRYVPLELMSRTESGATFLGRDLQGIDRKSCKIEQVQIDSSFTAPQLDVVADLFDREADVLNKLGAHPKIPRLLNALELTTSASLLYPKQRLFYLVQEYIEGQSLQAELITKGKFTEVETISVLREVARILEFVHFQGAIHRNIKPANIIRDVHGQIYLVNFGTTEQIVAQTNLAIAGMREHHSSSLFAPASDPGIGYQRQPIYPSSDLYSLAVTCLNLLTGKNPQDLLESESNNWQWRMPDLQVSEALAEILDKMLQKLPVDRFPSARDVLDRLDDTWGTPTLSMTTTSIPAASMSASTTLLMANVDVDIDSDSLQFENDFLQFDEDFLQFERELLQLDSAPLQIYSPSAPITEIRPTRSWKSWQIAGVLAISTIGLIIAIVPKFLTANNVSQLEHDAISNRSSVGERILLGFEGNRDTDKFKELKRAGVLAIANKNYAEAISKLQSALAENPNSPETRIYLNNALIGDRQSYTIAAAAPISRSLDRASEMLRGFAQAQAEINQVGAVNEAKIKLKIVDDSDDPKLIESISNAIVKHPEILGVVGHNRNDVSIKAANIYNDNKLSFIAPIGTANRLTGTDKPYIFRTNSKGDAIAKKLVDRLIDTDRKQKIAIFYVPTIATNQEFKNQFVDKLTARGGQVVGAFPFSTVSSTASPPVNNSPTFDAEAHLQEATAMGADAILLLSVGRANREALKVLRIRASKYPNLIVFGDTALYSMNTLKAGKESEGLILGVPWQEADSTPQFATGAKQLWNDRVNWATATSYNAVKALGTAIKTQETPSRSGVMEVLAKNEFMGASGKFQFKNGEPTERYALVRVTQTPPNYKYSSQTGYDFIPIEDWWF
jgi:ABC-type branched-subunit amino acid transport system substrate-binding protein/serine/threonine protein kinase